MEIKDKLRLIRETSGLSQPAFATKVGMTLDTLRRYEQGLVKNPSLNEITKITCHVDFKKYTLWLMSNETAPEAGQISPMIEESRKRETG